MRCFVPGEIDAILPQTTLYSIPRHFWKKRLTLCSRFLLKICMHGLQCSAGAGFINVNGLMVDSVLGIRVTLACTVGLHAKTFGHSVFISM
jgi:hypothetical protein